MSSLNMADLEVLVHEVFEEPSKVDVANLVLQLRRATLHVHRHQSRYFVDRETFMGWISGEAKRRHNARVSSAVRAEVRNACRRGA